MKCDWDFEVKNFIVVGESYGDEVSEVENLKKL